MHPQIDLPRSCHELRLKRLQPDGDLRLTAETGTALQVIMNFQIYPGIAELHRTHPCYYYRVTPVINTHPGITDGLPYFRWATILCYVITTADYSCY